MEKEQTKKKSWWEHIKSGTAVGAGVLGGLAIKDLFSKPEALDLGKVLAARAAQRQSAAANAAKMAAIKSTLSAPLGAVASIAAPLTAGALGGFSILNTKKKFDKEIDSYTRDSMERQDDIIQMIKKRRERKQESLNNTK